ncbi:MAG: restriction endonuclease, partial [Blastocatellia bacterium]|nr:restriction endonuclease [Blastocatellia bacterium]
MDIRLDSTLLAEYRSGSQQARRLTEAWVASNLYCPAC